MGVWYEAEGTITVKPSDEAREIIARLEGFSKELQVVSSEGNDQIEVEVSGGIMCSYSTCEEFEDMLAELSQHTVKPAKLRTGCDNETGPLWIGRPDEVATAQDASRAAKAKRAAGKLSKADKVKLAKQLLDESK